MGRLFDIWSFNRSMAAAAGRLHPPDAWFVMTDPPYVLDQVLKLRRRLGGRVVHHVDDVYPDLAMALGALPENGLVGKWLRHRASRALASCDQILALGDCMARALREKGLSPQRIAVSPPWADGTNIKPVWHRENPFRQELNLSHSDFAVMYSGNMGRAHRFETILEAARLLQNERRIHFVFVGDGAKRREIEAFLGEYGPARFHLRPHQPATRLRETLSAGDLHLISLDPRAQGLIVPSKLAGILSVGRPVVFVGDSGNSVARAILRGECGFIVKEGQGGELAGLITSLEKAPELRRKLGEQGRRLFEREYDRTVVVPRIIARLEGLCN